MMGKRKRDELGVRTVPYVSNLDCPIDFGFVASRMALTIPVIDLPVPWSTLLRLLIIHCMADLDLPVDLLAFYKYNLHHNLFHLSPRLLRPSLSPRNFLARLQTLFVSRPRWQRLRIAAGVAQ